MFRLLRKLRFLFLFFVILLYCLVRAIEAQTGVWYITDYLLVVLIVASLLVIGQQEQKLLVWLVGLALLQTGLILAELWIGKTTAELLKSVFAVLFFLLMTVACIRLTLKDKTISVTTLFGSLSAYLFIGLSFSYLYLFMYSLYPDSISGLMPHTETRSIYYSFITLTTVGFGDIVADSPVMQCLSWMEAFCGQAYLAVFISQLVGRYIAESMISKEQARNISQP
ncbi:potassium channel family protein [Legionella spiritensis]|uniref:Ion channel n=1 Tax=Legionella spiritensis TaxID=452 RepID=A0A0W0Z0C2_LEGSP|nr:potassium channel family protein [Legionella spiritensis]KTD62568.1 Ion channel [Legionella spiritensis]SNV30613.1 Ion channel [Legionella spiritensis]